MQLNRQRFSGRCDAAASVKGGGSLEMLPGDSTLFLYFRLVGICPFRSDWAFWIVS